VLVRQLKDGEGSAGAQLVRRYEASLLGYLRRLAGSDHMAEELHQATWLSVLEHLDKFDSEGSGTGGFKAWLFRIATNKANDWWRRNGREQAAKSGLRLVGDQASEAQDRPEAAEQVERLREAIGKLPEAQREVLLLRYYSGLKFVEIAEMLGCPLNTALGRMHKAMTKLKRLMQEP
jgi:RNA polymerase sigma-70 factor (ECF subfamily)